MLDQIQDEIGQTCSTPKEIEEAFVGYYRNLFTTAKPKNVELCTSSLCSKVSIEMNNKLVEMFIEVKMALDQMAPLKALSPDGFTANFYKQQWAIVGQEVCRAALYFLNFTHMNGSINTINIALIPKLKNPKCVTDF